MPPTLPYILRPPRIGDIGWVIHRHAVLYAEEYGWNHEFEAMVAEIGAGFMRDFDPRREACWIAERAGAVVGSCFLVRADEQTAKLRLIYVEPAARGLGIGRRMVDEALHFARAAGYGTAVLWTNDVLVAARRIYQAAGFTLVKAEPHHSFGTQLVGEYWERPL
jgi:GNAT superfamily N-acetyltransferase